MGPRLGRVEYNSWRGVGIGRFRCFNGATLRTRGILLCRHLADGHLFASMGPRLGRVEYGGKPAIDPARVLGFNGATLRTRGILL